MKRLLLFLIVLAVAAAWLLWSLKPRLRLPPTPRTVEQVITALAPQIEPRLEKTFANAGITYPPPDLALVVFKEEKRLEVHARDKAGRYRLVFARPILAASGTAGPKLREGDRQVPEGFYRIELLNPNSSYHVSMRLNYPNADDIQRAAREGRDMATLGGDIMIHGGAASIGCLAIGDDAAEELFLLAARTGLDQVRVVIAPCDLRRGKSFSIPASAPSSTHELHHRLREELAKY